MTAYEDHNWLFNEDSLIVAYVDDVLGDPPQHYTINTTPVVVY